MAMNSSFLSSLLAGLLSVGLLASASASPVTLIKDGKANASIVVQKEAPAPVKKSATDLQLYLKKLTSVELPLITDGPEVKGASLNVGRTSTAQDSDFPDLQMNPETYAITQRGGNIYFAGNHPSPIAFAVYSFLQDQLGIRWFAPGEDWEYVPVLSEEKKRNFTIDVQNVVSEPSTSPRIWSGHQWTQDWKDWCLRNKAVQSEKVNRRNFQNYIHRVFPPSKYGKTHPEYYPLIKGERWIPDSDGRTDWWPCMGSPEVQRVTVEYIREHFRKHPESDSFSLGMDDIYHMCDDPQCHALDGDPVESPNRRKAYSSRFYKFVNIIAKEIKKSNPDKFIGILIYSITVEPPSDVLKMEDNVFGFLADGSVAQWYQPGKKAEWMERTREWRKRVKYLSRYDYYGMGTHVPRVFPHAISESIQFDKELKFEGMYVELYTFLPQTAPMIWAFAQQQWDSGKNIDFLLHDFYSKMFPDSATEVQAYFDLMEYSWNSNRPDHTGWVHRNLLHQATSISAEAVELGREKLVEAIALAKTSLEKKRLDVILGGLQFGSYAVLQYDLAQRLGEAQINSKAQAEAAKRELMNLAELIRDRRVFWDSAVERQDLLGANARAMLAPGRRGRSYIQTDFTVLERPAIPALLGLLSWYRSHQPDQEATLVAELNDSFTEGLLHDILAARHNLDRARRAEVKSLLTNHEFRVTAGGKIPEKWSQWSRHNTANFSIASGRESQESAVRIEVPETEPAKHDIGVVYQNLSAKPGNQYVATVWTKLDNIDRAGNVSLTLHWSGKSGRLQRSVSRVSAAKSEGWQQLVVTGVAPEETSSVAVQFGAEDTSASFTGVECFLIEASVK